MADSRVRPELSTTHVPANHGDVAVDHHPAGAGVLLPATTLHPGHSRYRCKGLVRVQLSTYPGCALQSTSEPALHRRNVPNCRPTVDGAMRKCSAGACPPLGSGSGGVRPPGDGQNHPVQSHFHPLMRSSQGHGNHGVQRRPLRRADSRYARPALSLARKFVCHAAID